MAKSSYGVIARLVWDGGVEVRIPEELGVPAQNQMQGTAGERLTELSGRACYDSLGKGRSSKDYHGHILEVGHLSVCEHFHATVQTAIKVDPWTLINRPGIWARRVLGQTRLTFNPRVVLDWDQWSRELGVDDLVASENSLGNQLSYHMEQLCDALVKPRDRSPGRLADYREWSRVVDPEHHEEKWISLFLSGSRGFSHEQVRHRFRTGVSQRSTRFVDEDGSPWVDHPLVQEYLRAQDVPEDERKSVDIDITAVKGIAGRAYANVADRLQNWLMSKGVDKFNSRKQARGAARGYLGNALSTEMIFSASVAQWKRMLRLRCVQPADAEIRVIMAEALPELKASRYGSEFEAFEMKPASDGLGQIAVERK